MLQDMILPPDQQLPIVILPNFLQCVLYLFHRVNQFLQNYYIYNHYQLRDKDSFRFRFRFRCCCCFNFNYKRVYVSLCLILKLFISFSHYIYTYLCSFVAFFLMFCFFAFCSFVLFLFYFFVYVLFTSIIFMAILFCFLVPLSFVLQSLHSPNKSHCVSLRLCFISSQKNLLMSRVSQTLTEFNFFLLKIYPQKFLLLYYLCVCIYICHFLRGSTTF